MLNFVRVAVQSHKVNLVSLDRNVGDDVLVYELPVDSKLQEFTISISGENPHISILDPQGTPLLLCTTGKQVTSIRLPDRVVYYSHTHRPSLYSI